MSPLLQFYALAPPEELASAAHAILQDLSIARLLPSGKYSVEGRPSTVADV